MDSDNAHMIGASKVPMLKPENGPTLLKTQVVEGVTTFMPITSVKDKAQRRLEVKLMEAIKKRFGGNDATKKTQRNLLKQQYENFTASNIEMLDQTFDRRQKHVNQLVLLVNIAQAVTTAIGVSTAGTQVNIANIDNLSDAVICALLASQPSSSQLINEDLEHIHPDDFEKMELRWQMA
nr:hypothetical protein [Tanacetum cinerariifolium]